MPFNETEEGKTHSFNDGCNPPHEMPTTPHEEPTKSESVEEIVEKFEKKFVYYTPTGNMLLNDIAASVDNGMNAFLASSLTTAYAQGRASMKKEIEAVVPKDGENVHSVYTRCWDCLTWGINMPNEKECGNCRSMNTSEYWPDCRSQLLTNIEGIV